MSVEPFLDDTDRGLFATRAPRRPNRIGLSVVTIEAIEDTTLTVGNVDVLDGTPLLDLKPYVPTFDTPDAPAVGWLDATADAAADRRSDDRFC